MLRVVAVLALLGVIVYSLLDCAQTPPSRIRALPKPVWLLAILAVPVFGAIAWLLAGRPVEASGPVRRRGPSSRPLAPDDDPDFLRDLGRRSPPRQAEPREPQRPGDDEEPEDKPRS